MKSFSIQFFSLSDNSLPKEKKEAKPKKVVLTGYISGAGKLVFPAKTVAQLGSDFESSFFKIGTQEGKRKAKSLYLVKSEESADSFQVQPAAKSVSISLPVLLKKIGVDFSETKYTFIIKPFEYEGAEGFELELSTANEEEKPKVEYTGKRRGRKPKNREVEA